MKFHWMFLSRNFLFILPTILLEPKEFIVLKTWNLLLLRPLRKWIIVSIGEWMCCLGASQNVTWWSQKPILTLFCFCSLNSRDVAFYVAFWLAIIWPSQLGLQNTLTAVLQRGKTPPMSVLDMTLNNLIVMFQ